MSAHGLIQSIVAKTAAYIDSGSEVSSDRLIDGCALQMDIVDMERCRIHSRREAGMVLRPQELMKAEMPC